MNPLKNNDDFAAALKHSEKEPVFIFKHSATCPISRFAEQSVQSIQDDYPVYKVIVQQSRALSQSIAQDLRVHHESPQIILLQNGEVVTDLSHGRIREEALKTLWEDASQAS